MATPSASVDICNMSLGRIGAKRLANAAELSADTTVLAIHCNLHYDQTRDALLRSYWWRFAGARAELETTDTPDFEWDYAFSLPDDFLAFRSIYEDNNTPLRNTVNSFKLEGNVIMWDDSSMEIRYTKQVTTVADFDPLFIEVFVLQLCLKLIPQLAGVGSTGQSLLAEIKRELYGSPRQPGLMSKVRAMDRQEQNNVRRASLGTWNYARAANQGRIDSRLGSG